MRTKEVKRTVESMRSIDVRKLKRDGMLVPNNRSRITWEGVSGKHSTAEIRVEEDAVLMVLVKYWYRDEPVHTTIKIKKTHVRYDRYRQWFECPNCDKGAAILYLDNFIGCRACHNLNYASHKETKSKRLLRKMKKIQAQLKSDDPTYKLPPRPFKMSSNTYVKLQLKHTKARRETLDLMAQEI